MSSTVPNSNAQGSAGAYAGNATAPQNGANTIASLLEDMKKNFLERDIEIMPGLMFNQYRTLQTCHYYLNSQFEGGNLDENGNDKFFHNLITHRNAHTTKNIDLDTKDVRVTTELDNKYWASWLLRMELKDWMRKNRFASNLNQLASSLPDFGTVVWKKVKCKGPDGKIITTVKNVDLRNLINDQTVESLKDSQLVAERAIMTAQEIRNKAEEDVWDKEQVDLFLQAMPVKKDHFLKQGASENAGAYSLTDTLPSADVYEVWGWVPETYLPDAPADADDTKYKYIMAIVGGLENGGGARTLFCEEAEVEDFPYKETHMRKTVGRWLGLGNTELLIPLQIRANELVNRFFMALRLGSVHLFQTRGRLYQKNLLQDALDGDIIESTHPIEPVATEIRAFQQYQVEMQQIEALADKICNTPEVVSGESMPAATPFRLGAMLGNSAAKIFDFVRENCGIFVGDVMRNWILDDLAESITAEHMLDLIGSVEDLAAFDEAYRKSVLYSEVKTYVLGVGHLPTAEEFQIAERALSDQMKNGDRKIKIEEDFYDEDFLNTAQIVIDPTGESEDKAAMSETLGNVLQIVTSNPMALQDPTIRMIMGKIMEMNGMSPIKLAGFVSQPQPPAGAMGAASPANAKFAANPGDAGANGEQGLTPSSVAASPAMNA